MGKLIHHHFILIASVCLIPLLLLVGCSREASRTEFLLNTVCKIRISGGDESDLDAAFERIRQIESTMSSHISGNEISRIGSNSVESTQLSVDTCLVIKKALHFSLLSDGLFDITIAPVVGLWGFGTEHAQLPTAHALNKVLPLVDYTQVRILDNCRIVTAPEQQVDLGGIAKGYASDEAAKVLQEAGVKRALINLGGNVFAFGKKKDGSLWKLGIQDPLRERGSVLGTLEIGGGAVVTSGIYERYVEHNGKRYHHLLNPNTGYPFVNNVAGVSITAPSGLDADALSTAVFLLGIEKGCKLLDDFPQSGAVFITKNREITTYGIASAHFTLTNQDYKVIDRR